MLSFLFQSLMVVGSISWLISVYSVKMGWNFILGNVIITNVVMFMIPILLTLIAIAMLPKNGEDSLSECKDFDRADSSFMPVYLGYFFVALSVPDNTTLCFLAILLLILVWRTRIEFFNPVLLLLGYHYYHVTTAANTRIFLIKRGKAIRNCSDIASSTLYRINDTTFIERGGC